MGSARVPPYHFGPLVAPSFYDQESDLALRGGVATARLCEVVVRRDIDGGSRMVWMEGGTTLGAKEEGGGLRGAHADLAEATSRTDQQRAAGRG